MCTYGKFLYFYSSVNLNLLFKVKPIKKKQVTGLAQVHNLPSSSL